jgi:hypothetical protein
MIKVVDVVRFTHKQSITHDFIGFTLLQENDPSYYYTDLKVRLWRYKCRRINKPEIISEFPTERSQARGGVFSKMYLGHNRPLYEIEDYGHLKWILK